MEEIYVFFKTLYFVSSIFIDWLVLSFVSIVLIAALSDITENACFFYSSFVFIAVCAKHYIKYDEISKQFDDNFDDL